MKILTYISARGGAPRAGVSFDGETVFSLEELGWPQGMGVLDLIRALDGRFDRLRAPASGGEALDGVRLLAPIPQPANNVICVGLNYKSHVAESDSAGILEPAKEDAVYFTKNVNRATDPGGLIDGHFDICDSLDYESELAVVLGRDAYRVPKERAGDYIFGFTVANDVTARSIQKGRGQWFLGKSLDSFFPLGPWIVTADELGTAPALPIRSYVNGELRQNGHTGDLIHSVAEIIEDLSRGITLRAGTILSTGTPAGVGMGFRPPRYLKSGDLVRCEIEGIGVLENRVK